MPEDKFVIEANDPINLVAFREALLRWTLYPIIDDWELSAAEVEMIQNEKQNLKQGAVADIQNDDDENSDDDDFDDD